MSNKDDDNDDYKVGYKKPPKHSQYKKGVSGNKKGRPKGPNGPTAFLPHFFSMLNEIIKIKGPDGRLRKIRKGDVIFQNQITKAMKGDAKATTQVIDMLKRGGYLNPPDESKTRTGVIGIPEPLSQEEWIEKYGKRIHPGLFDDDKEDEEK